MTEDHKHMAERLRPIMGGTIEGLAVDEETYALPCYALRVTNGGKSYDLWILADPEGNGPGHLSVEEVAASDSEPAH